MREPEDQYCQKCGAQPGEACRTTGGNRTTMHTGRRDGPAKQACWKATRLGCWRVGWKAGTSMMSIAQAHELAPTYLAPQDFLDGWIEGRAVAEERGERARRRLMS